MILSLYKSFGREFLKIASKSYIHDADMRALLDEREGKEYLKGGRLQSNSPEEQRFVIKFPFGGQTKTSAFSPSMSLKNIGQVGKIKNVIRNFTPRKAAGLIGKKFRLPSY